MPAPDYAPEIAQLEEAIATGYAKVTADGETIEYRTANDILKGIRYFEGKARRAGGGQVGANSILVFEGFGG